MKAAIEGSKSGSYDLEYENGMNYKQRQAFRSLGEKKPDINKGRPFFNKLGAKIKAVWSKDYAALMMLWNVFKKMPSAILNIMRKP